MRRPLHSFFLADRGAPGCFEVESIPAPRGARLQPGSTDQCPVGRGVAAAPAETPESCGHADWQGFASWEHTGPLMWALFRTAQPAGLGVCRRCVPAHVQVFVPSRLSRAVRRMWARFGARQVRSSAPRLDCGCGPVAHLPGRWPGASPRPGSPPAGPAIGAKGSTPRAG
jgi:hypothetical protein